MAARGSEDWGGDLPFPSGIACHVCEGEAIGVCSGCEFVFLCGECGHGGCKGRSPTPFPQGTELVETILGDHRTRHGLSHLLTRMLTHEGTLVVLLHVVGRRVITRAMWSREGAECHCRGCTTPLRDGYSRVIFAEHGAHLRAPRFHHVAVRSGEDEGEARCPTGIAVREIVDEALTAAKGRFEACTSSVVFTL